MRAQLSLTLVPRTSFYLDQAAVLVAADTHYTILIVVLPLRTLESRSN
jgi:hypothetical protein